MIEPKKKCKLLIEAILKNPSRYDILNHPPIQNKVFSYGVRITNIDDCPFPGGEIQNILIKSGENQDLIHSNALIFAIPLLNPGQIKEIIFGNVETKLCGIIFLHINIDSTVDVVTFQSDAVNKISVELKNANNYWVESIFVVSAFENQQMWTNRWLVGLTIITLIQGLWGLKEAVRFCWNFLINLFLVICNCILEVIGFFGNIKSPH